MESKLLMGGKNIVDHTNEQQRALEQRKQEISDQKVGLDTPHMSNYISLSGLICASKAECLIGSFLTVEFAPDYTCFR